MACIITYIKASWFCALLMIRLLFMTYLSTPSSIHCMTRCSFFSSAVCSVSCYASLFFSGQPATGCSPLPSYPFILEDLVKAVKAASSQSGAHDSTSIDASGRFAPISLLPPYFRCPPPSSRVDSLFPLSGLNLSLSPGFWRRGGGAQGYLSFARRLAAWWRASAPSSTVCFPLVLGGHDVGVVVGGEVVVPRRGGSRLISEHACLGPIEEVLVTVRSSSRRAASELPVMEADLGSYPVRPRQIAHGSTFVCHYMASRAIP
jgi:hypothetical protein